ncbi:hypothetical protein C1646_682894 [Rhizophagus diaphanus]|nr:hypothetical protein C1646_682894 [Rhizophagus diaphanus] [Rhizophagus sp. MUCL 43196]
MLIYRIYNQYFAVYNLLMIVKSCDISAALKRCFYANYGFNFSTYLISNSLYYFFIKNYIEFGFSF